MAGIPAKYAFLSSVGVLPRTVTYGLALLGTNEVPGKGSNKVIESWRDELNKAGCSVVGFSDDGIPWCGLFAAIVVLRAGKVPQSSPLWAMNWAKWGVEIASNTGTTAKPKLTFKPGLRASLGDVLVFQRKTATGFAGHVGFYVAEDATAFHVLGGNQSDAVTITRVAKDRCIAVRRPPMTTPPPSLKPYVIAANGALSTNEA